MATRLLARIAVALVLLVEAAGIAAQGPPERAAARAKPVVVAADRHDKSRPLRDIPAIAPGRAPAREIPEPRRLRRGAPARGVPRDPVVQNYASAQLMPAPAQSFDGLSNVNGVLPPDPNGAVGPNHYVETVNLSFGIYSKGSGGSPPALLYGPAAGNTLWSGFGGPCETNDNGDPIVLYDHLADRWVMSELALPNVFFGVVQGPFYQCLAISATSDPTGAYYRYQFSFDKLNDYPKLAVWPDAYFMTINQYESVTLNWAGQGVVAFDREKMLAGEDAGLIYLDLAPVDMNLGGMLPAALDGQRPPAGSPGYFMQVDDDAWGYAPDQLQLWRFHVDWTNPSASTFDGPTLLPTAPFDSDMCGYSRNCIPQAKTTATLDAISDRLMYRLEYRNLGTHESLVVNHTVDADGTDHAGIRWYEIRDPRTSPAIFQQSTYAPDADHRWMGSTAMDGAGDIALGFSVSGRGTSPSVRYTGRLAGDPPGTMTQGEAEIVAGTGSQTSSSGRWGDYSMLAVDPIDDCTYWYTQEYYASTSSSSWRTRIGSFAFPSCQPSALPAVSIVATTPAATEAGQVPGAFTVTRTGDLASPLTVTYTVGGTATPGSDYVALPGTLTIPAGASSATIPVTPIDDLIVEYDESVLVVLNPASTYRAGVPSEALVTIISDDVPPDLVVTAVSAPATAGAGTTISVTDTTANQGSGAAVASQTGFYLSTDTSFGSTDVLLGGRSVPALNAGTADSTSTLLTIPAGTATGSYYVIAKADVNNALIETQEGNNTRASAIVRVGPDLVVNSVSVPSSATPGAVITVSDTTANTGGGAGGSSATQYYLSANAALDSADVLLGSRPVAALSAAGTDSGSAAVTIPAATSAGVYYVIAKADGTNAVSETNETNNTRASQQVKIGADLIVASLTAPAQAGAGGSITVGDTTQNTGSVDAAASTTAFYLSANTLLDSTDVLLGSRAVPALAAGTSSAGSTAVIIPASTATGTYYLIAKADAGNVVTESIETNNTKVGSVIRIGPDLTVSAVGAPSSAAPGGAITVSDTTVNQGAGAAGGSTTQYYLSANTLLDSTDVLLGGRSVAALGPAASNSGSIALTVPTTTAAGTYYVIAKADGGNAIVETNETNNTRTSGQLKIGADLMVSSLAAPTQAGAGTSIAVSDTTQNAGTVDAGASTTSFYLSANTVLESADVLLGSRAVPALAAGTSSSGTTSVSIPAGTATGTYYIVAKADSGNVVAESVETNNTRASASIRIGPDLVVTALTVPSSASPGGAITVSDTTANQGGGPAGASTTQYYLSANTVVDAGDVVLGARAVGALVAAATDSGSVVVTIPPTTPAGVYYVIASADGGNAVVETSETNNTRASQQVKIGADLVVASVAAPTLAGAGNVISVGDTTQNIGTADAAASTTAFYLSANTLLDASDVLLGTRAVPALASGASSSGTTPVTIPAGTATGTYYIIAKADNGGTVPETQETNNTTTSSTLRIGPNLVVSAVSGPGTAAAGAAIAATDTTSDVGGGAAPSSTTQYYLSVNTVRDGTDVLIGSRSVGALAAGAGDTGSATLVIPAGTVAGTYYVLAVADGPLSIVETNETDNTRVFLIKITTP